MSPSQDQRAVQAPPSVFAPSTATERTALLQDAGPHSNELPGHNVNPEENKVSSSGPGTSRERRWSFDRTPSLSSTLTSDSEATIANASVSDVSPLDSLSRSRVTALALAFISYLLLQAINVTMMTTTQGQISEDLDAYDKVSWFTSVYLIGMSSMSPVFGRMSQVFSIRSCVLVATIFFSCGVFIASQAQSLSAFLVGRTFQGIGAAGALSLCVILVIQLAPVHRRGLLVGTANSAVTMGVSIGAIIGGAFGESIGWRALMCIQSPLAIAAGITVFVTLRGVERRSPSMNEEVDPAVAGDDDGGNKSLRSRKLSSSSSCSRSSPGPSHDQHLKSREQTALQKLWSFDYSGSILLVAGISSLLVALSAPSSRSLIIGAIAIGLLTLFVLNEIYRASSPVVPVAILGSRGVLLSCLAQIFLMTARVSVLLYAPIFTQAVLLWPATQAGAILIPTNGGFAIGGLVVGQLHIRRAGSFYVPVLVCCLLFSLSLLGLGLTATAACPGWLLALLLFALGASTGAALNYFLAHVLHLSLPENHAVATSLLETFRGFSGSLGSAAGGGLFKAVLQRSLEDRFREEGLLSSSLSVLSTTDFGNATVSEHGAATKELIQKLLGQPELVAELAGVKQAVARAGYEDAVRALFMAAAALALVTVFVQAGTGWRGPNEKRVGGGGEDGVGNGDRRKWGDDGVIVRDE